MIFILTDVVIATNIQRHAHPSPHPPRHRRKPPQAPEPTTREPEREDRFVAGAQTAFAEHGRNKVTVTGVARALRTPAAMLRHCFCDLDAQFAKILHRHLSSLANAFGAIYLALTRTALGGFNEARMGERSATHQKPPVHPRGAPRPTGTRGDRGPIHTRAKKMPSSR